MPLAAYCLVESDLVSPRPSSCLGLGWPMEVLVYFLVRSIEVPDKLREALRLESWRESFLV